MKERRHGCRVVENRRTDYAADGGNDCSMVRSMNREGDSLRAFCAL